MKRWFVLVMMVLVAGCATTSTAPSGDVDAAIRAQADRFETSMRGGRVDEVAAFYADDAVLMPPGAPAIPGAGIRGFWGMVLAGGTSDLDLIVENVRSSGDLAVERGRYEVTKPFKDSGKYIVVWQNRGGEWRIVNDIFNSSLAPPASQ